MPNISPVSLRTGLEKSAETRCPKYYLHCIADWHRSLAKIHLRVSMKGWRFWAFFWLHFWLFSHFQCLLSLPFRPMNRLRTTALSHAMALAHAMTLLRARARL